MISLGQPPHDCPFILWQVSCPVQRLGCNLPARQPSRQRIIDHRHDQSPRALLALRRHATCPLQGGAESGATPTDFQFTGQRKEAGFGLYDYHARRVARPADRAVRERGFNRAGGGQAAGAESVWLHP
jgi:hypothetical protein